ncbi:MAG TPA: hypothetical protein VFV50_06585 [Bdellovibrionales bacterium]|nr:hypothetical protein [Bdellovibrionales bacterium]
MKTLFAFALVAITALPFAAHAQLGRNPTVDQDVSPKGVYKRAILKKLNPQLRLTIVRLYQKYYGDEFPKNIDQYNSKLDPSLHRLIDDTLEKELRAAKSRFLMRAESGTAEKLRKLGFQVGSDLGDILTAAASLWDVLEWSALREFHQIEGGVRLYPDHP